MVDATSPETLHVEYGPGHVIKARSIIRPEVPIHDPRFRWHKHANVRKRFDDERWQQQRDGQEPKVVEHFVLVLDKLEQTR